MKIALWALGITNAIIIIWALCIMAKFDNLEKDVKYLKDDHVAKYKVSGLSEAFDEINKELDLLMKEKEPKNFEVRIDGIHYVRIDNQLINAKITGKINKEEYICAPYEYNNHNPRMLSGYYGTYICKLKDIYSDQYGNINKEFK